MSYCQAWEKSCPLWCSRISWGHLVVDDLAAKLFSDKKAIALLYKLERCNIDLVKLRLEIVELSHEIYAKWEQQNDNFRRFAVW